MVDGIWSMVDSTWYMVYSIWYGCICLRVDRWTILWLDIVGCILVVRWALVVPIDPWYGPLPS